ncbi:tRNA (adenosine(37)-N6)-threonylcarbamoyltransferase complex ATPase subunit type 1 TsaE [Thiomicrorhabdus lithotrophica]|uniref:tRNA threonylcarbamoyladenosine biosynthesis protein TsaE n=1 Tax=Thiomicrorhabdus lithotrophica TaxID=2949997 RepID=A0ABY8C746_9GAMM|nr:tRNA (adenosine(37)-N6)-threonylcarbamoyltransferase complex ATPase subunit type 1 TsaE [Thiomicrorhabdus lithotrophica]WEJ61775.1 tRNA (adenosine(37)-N6)-threonylcarbamoyltransferase complex ATPase subunit type 1 TsaE [Thiomicrorhabdus lithotrophica]
MFQLCTEIELLDESESIDFAGFIAGLVDEMNGFEKGMIFYLYGDLGAGKSFFSRAFVQYYIPGQKVKSPTYTIVESYNFSTNTIHHLDLYRLCDPEELEYLAVRDLLKENFVALIEWPQKGAPILPPADVEFEFVYAPQGRIVKIKSISEKGKSLVEKIMLKTQ